MSVMTVRGGRVEDNQISVSISGKNVEPKHKGRYRIFPGGPDFYAKKLTFFWPHGHP